MPSLFDKAKKAAPATKKDAKKAKPRILINDLEFYEKVKKLSTLNKNIKSMTTESELIEGEIKEISRKEWADLYDKNGVNPDSVMIESKHNNDTAQFMFVINDKYIQIDEPRALYLKESFSDEIVTEEETYEFENEMVRKYGEIISNLILNCDDISEEDKTRIIKAKVKYSITKGTVDKLKIYADEIEGDVLDVMDEVRPVASIKNVEYIEGKAIIE